MTNTNIPEILFHYCSVETLVRVVESESILGSLNTELNDELENYYVYELLRICARNLYKQSNNKYLNDLLNLYSHNIVSSKCFVSCFSKDGDVLSQWRAYANDGKGVAIGVYTNNIDNIVSDESLLSNQEFRKKYWKRISYDKEALERKILDLCSNLKSESDVNRANAALVEESYHMKHPAFEEEQEYRIIEVFSDIPISRNSDGCFCFRATDNNLVPFVKHNIFSKTRALAGVYIGPKSRVDSGTIEMLMRKLNVEIDENRIIKSEAPYR